MRFKKGIILAAGKGTRLSPATKVTVKPLLPLYDKPLLYYALSNLIKAGVREVLFISQKKDIPEFRKLFGSGKQLGMKFSYTFQKKQVGIPDAVNIAKKFINKKPFVLALADNLFVGKSFHPLINTSTVSIAPNDLINLIEQRHSKVEFINMRDFQK